MRLWIINAIFWLLMALAGGVAGWWIRGRAERASANQHKRLVREAMEGLQDCTSKIRTRVAAHASDMKRVMEELAETDSPDSSVVNLAVEHIVDSTDQVRRQLSETEQKLQLEATVIGRSISEEQPELLFMKRLDHKKRLYRKVLHSLEMLASELAVDVDDHQSRIENIGEALEKEEAQNVKNVNSAVDQIIQATSNMQEKISSVEKRLDEQTAQVEKHAKLASKDELTELPNRRTFGKELHRLHEEYRRHKKPFSLLMIDVDYFKKINDQHGHQIGDAVLTQLGRLLAAQVRENDIAARYGGEEFAMLLPFTSEFDAKLAAERIRKACMAKPLRVEGKTHHITISVGVSAVLPDSAAESIVQRADQALYAAKNAGRNCTYWHDGTECIAFGTSKDETRKQFSAKFRNADAKKEPTSTRTSSKQEQAVPGIVIPPEFDLSNRSIFCVSVNRRLAECKRGGASISLLLLQIDQSDQIGKEHGPKAVMELRAALCRMLAALSRDMDDRCEFDAKTFAILLPDTTNESVRRIGERLRAGVAGCQMQFGNKKWDLTASVGVVNTDGSDSGMEFMNRGEKAVRAASSFGGNATFLADRTGVTRITNPDSQLNSH